MNGYGDEFDESYGYERDDDGDSDGNSEGVFKDSYYEDQYSSGEDYPHTGNLDAADAADEWLRANDDVNPNASLEQEQDASWQERQEEVAELTGSITGSQEQAGFGGETEYSAQLRRFSHMPTGVVRRTIAMLQDPQSQASIYGDKENMTSKAMLEGVSSFESLIGASSEDFARDLERQIPYGDNTGASTSRADVATAYSMFSKTAGIYAESGSALYGNELSEERTSQKERAMAEADTFAYDMAHRSVTGMLEGSRRELEVEKNYNYIMNQLLTRDNTPKVVTDFNTGAPVMQQVEEPILDARGQIVLDEKNQPSYHTVSRPMLKSNMIPMPSEMPGMGTIPDDLNQRFTYHNPTIYGSDEASKEAYSKMKDDWRRHSDALRKIALTSSDENNRNMLRAKNQLGLSEEHLAVQELRNEAMLLDLDRHKLHPAALSMEGTTNRRERLLSPTGIYGDVQMAGGTLKGSDQGGMYGNEGLSEMDIFIEQGLEKLGQVHSNEEVVDILSSMRQKGASDRDIYLARQRLSPQPEQGTEAWHKQREGMLTGSNPYGNVATEHKPETITKFAKELIKGNDKPFYKSEAMKLGTMMEPFVRENLGKFLTGSLEGDMLVGDSFKSGAFDTAGRPVKPTGEVSIEEAFFETNKELPGFSVSPDGFVFDREGKSMGLAEFKFHTEEDKIKSSLGDYMHQLQKQMMVTGEEQVHFFRQTKSGKFAYDLVRADKGMQRKLKRIGQSILTEAEYLKRGKTMPTYHSDVSGSGEPDAEVFRATTTEQHVPTAFNADKVLSSVRGRQAHHGQAGKVADYAAMFDALEAEEVAALHDEALEENARRTEAAAEEKRLNKKATEDLSNAFRELVVVSKDLAMSLGKLGGDVIDEGSEVLEQAARADVNVENFWGISKGAAQYGASIDDVNKGLQGSAAIRRMLSNPLEGGIEKQKELIASYALGGVQISPDEFMGKSTTSQAKFFYARAMGITDEAKRAEALEASGLFDLYGAMQKGMPASVFDQSAYFNKDMAFEMQSGKNLTQREMIEGGLSAMETVMDAGVKPEDISYFNRLRSNPMDTIIRTMSNAKEEIFGSVSEGRTADFSKMIYGKDYVRDRATKDMTVMGPIEEGFNADKENWLNPGRKSIFGANSNSWLPSGSDNRMEIQWADQNLNNNIDNGIPRSSIEAPPRIRLPDDNKERDGTLEMQINIESDVNAQWEANLKGLGQEEKAANGEVEVNNAR